MGGLALSTFAVVEGGGGGRGRGLVSERRRAAPKSVFELDRKLGPADDLPKSDYATQK